MSPPTAPPDWPPLEIARRFEGPPGTGNGGYVAGRLAAVLGVDSAECTLRRPVPTGRRLRLEASDGAGVSVYDGDRCVAVARPASLDFPCPPPPSFDEAWRVEGRCRAYQSHPFPGCFVCGPEAGPGGLAILPGPIAPAPGSTGARETSRVAAPWIPGADLDGEAGSGEGIAPCFVWAALDCPTVFPLLEAPESRALEPMVLGRLTASVRQRPVAGERCVVLAWGSAPDGRRALGRAALYREDGSVAGLAEGIWISIAGAGDGRGRGSEEAAAGA